MLLKLLKRDLRLHWDALVIPLLILVLVMGAIGMANEGAALAGLVFCSFLFIPVLPMAIHFRESSQGTMGDLLALPISRPALVSLRYLEVLLFAAGLIALAHLGTWVALSAAAHKAVHFDLMDRPGVYFICVLLLFLFAYPMPFFLRWGLKGIGFAYVPVVIVFTIHGLFFVHFGEGVLYRSVIHLIARPGQMTLGILSLFSLSFVLSWKAFAGRDF